MAQRNRLTNNSDETDVASLISGDNIFSIPYFQRPYKWKPERLQQLQLDLLNIVDEDDTHFLGAIIVHGRRTNPSEPDIFDVIDGQQRITTLFLYVAASIKVLCESGEQGEAAGLLLKYLVIGRPTTGLSNLKLHSCKEDRRQLNRVLSDLLEDATLVQNLGGFKFLPLPISGREVGALWSNYCAACSFFRDEFKQSGLDRVRAIYRALLERMSVVQIDVWDPTNGPKIFDSLNSRQEPMTVGDLVRNEIFSKVAGQDVARIERVDLECWQPFYQKFKQGDRNYFDGYFFPFGLVKNPNLKKSEVYGALKREWAGFDDPTSIIQQLSKYQDIFLDFCCGTNFISGAAGISSEVRRIHHSNFPSSLLPFLMQLGRAAVDGQVSTANVKAVLAMIESFLVRRALCGVEPTGLHAVFKRLWVDCDGEVTVARVAAEIGKHKTVAWPDDRAVGDAVKSRPIYGSAICEFVVREYDRSLRGDNPIGPIWIEHILPRNPDASWFAIFAKEQHKQMKDLLANLLPLSSELNASLGNAQYDIKRPRYRAESMYKSPREFSETYSEWTPSQLADRSDKMASWVVKRWPFHG